MSDNSTADQAQRFSDKSRASDGRAGDVWLRPQRVVRDAPPLSRRRIVTAAIELLDEQGVERLTMRRLAQRLGTGSTTLYWHVDTKNDVLDLVLDELFAEVDLPEPAAGQEWTETIVALLTGWRAAMLRHPWSATLLGRPMLGPNVLARTEFLHATLANADFTPPDLNSAAYALANYVTGAVLSQTAWQNHTGREIYEPANHLLRERSDSYPVLAGLGFMAENDWDGNFAVGLRYLLDGIAAARSAGSPPVSRH
ncbi:TetR/AcrR family transcriptional regulator C-terminal domain-containing protein [Micromonospora sp. WMMD998]|uniref:TetR/AcrR family transcriptional regulator n=1 Tax=Micromonospora sp. WMMD998 TaxID=3016092 RepID=UPI00249AB7AC|nr:TetR/AcrR family transcriptional regulator C-terminal domain-containing protein [Micromonospora sp. WMMD998]WFE41140.1 TetR/AcrR family transcriptional regulator C-terminal domain-containing protein [Micromonospora sp. WMMD998]